MDELMKLFGEWDIELPDELADQVAGGNSRVPASWVDKGRFVHFR